MLLKSTEVHIQFMEMLQKRSKGSACSHLGKSIHVLREALATITKLSIRTRDISMRVINIA